MPRQPDPESKVAQVVLYAKNPGEEEKIRAFKEIARKERDNMREILLQGVDAYLQLHRWHPIHNPHGHSQAIMPEFTKPPEPKPLQCHFCKDPAVGYAMYQGKMRRPVCSTHKEELRAHPKWTVAE